MSLYRHQKVPVSPNADTNTINTTTTTTNNEKNTTITTNITTISTASQFFAKLPQFLPIKKIIRETLETTLPNNLSLSTHDEENV